MLFHKSTSDAFLTASLHLKTQPDVQRLAIFLVHSFLHAFHFLFVGHLSCEARSIGQKISKGHHRAMVAALSYTFCMEHMRLNCSFPVLNQSAYIVVR